jgi:hypothetical protein
MNNEIPRQIVIGSDGQFNIQGIWSIGELLNIARGLEQWIMSQQMRIETPPIPAPNGEREVTP